MDEFVHLHVHSEYSVLDGMIQFEPLLERVKEIGQPAVAITDHGSLGGFYQWYKAQSKSDVKGIIGIEFYVVSDMAEKGSRQRWHLVALAQNITGFKNLLKLSTISHVDGFYYKPRIDLEHLLEHKEGLILLSACVDGVVPSLLKERMISQAQDVLQLFQNELGDNFYIELQPHGFAEQVEINPLLYEQAQEFNIKCVAANDCHYLNKEDWETHEILLCMQVKDKLKDPDHFSFEGTGYYIKTREEMFQTFKENHKWMEDAFINEMLDNTLEIADKCEFEIEKLQNVVPSIDTGGMDDYDYLVELCRKGWKNRGLGSGNEIYLERLKYELGEIKRLGFTKYFLVVWDLYNWSRKQGIMSGPARGSSAGSLVCYLLDIVKVDPIKYGLIFERFIAPDRITSPDIDMDFQDDRRDEIKEYLREKYGYVCDIGTFGRLKGKSAVKDVARVLDVSYPETNKITSLIIERSSGDARASATIEDSFNEFEALKEYDRKYPEVKRHAVRLEGLIRQVSIHAAGVALAPFPLHHLIPLEKRGGTIVSAVDGKDCDELGLLKLDVLGLKTLTVIKQALDAIWEREGVEIDLNLIPLDDEQVIKKFAEGNLTGVFQFDSIGMAKTCREAPVETFNDIVVLNALYRPGGMRSGLSTIYLKRRGGKEYEGRHEIYDEITKDTYGAIIYQEQVMAIFGRMAGYDAINVDRTRRAVAKSHGVEELERQRPTFVNGCAERGVPEDVADSIFTDIAHFGSYGFNKSHAVAYSLISYWTQWLRTYYPLELYTALLNCEKDTDKVKGYINKIRRIDDIEVLPPDINKSRSKFGIDGDAIRCGLAPVKGVGKTSIPEIENNRPYTDLEDFETRTQKKKVRKNVIENLIKAGAFKEMHPNTAQTLYDFQQRRMAKKDRDESPKIFEPWSEEEENKIATEVYPLPPLKHPLYYFKSLLDAIDPAYRFIDTAEMDWEAEGFGIGYMKGCLVDMKYNRIGDFDIKEKTPEEKKRMKYKWGSRYVNCNLEDETGVQRTRIPPPEYDRFEPIITKGNGTPVILRVKILPNLEMVSVLEIVDLIELRDKWERGANEEMSRFEKALFNHPVKMYELTAFEIDLLPLEEVEDQQVVKTYGMVSKIAPHMAKNGEMAFIDIEGLHGIVEVIVWPDSYTKFKKELKIGNVVAIQMSRTRNPRNNMREWQVDRKDKIKSMEKIKKEMEKKKV